ncbi:MAG: hypothetical protein JSU59_05310, partial [Nitrospirota bacterium]
MAKSELQGRVKRVGSLKKEKEPLSDHGPAPSPLTEKNPSEPLDPLLETVGEMDTEITGPVEQTVHQQEAGEPNRKFDEANVDLEG